MALGALKRPTLPRELHLRVLVYKLKQDAAEYNSASNYSECFASFMESEPSHGQARQKFRPPVRARETDRPAGRLGRLLCSHRHK